MSYSIDRFVLLRDPQNRITKGWRVERYSFGWCIIQHCKTGRSNTGVIDDFGNVVSCDSYMISVYKYNNETLVEYYK